MIIIRQQTSADHAAIEVLLDAAFGPARKSNSAYALRAGVAPVAELSLIAAENGAALGCIHFTPVAVAPAAGSAAARGLLLLGPLAVDPARHGEGIGQALVDHSLAGAADLGYRAAVLVGDPAYYGRFGFDHALVAGIVAPGEADQRRVQGHEIVPGALGGVAGTLVRAGPASAES